MDYSIITHIAQNIPTFWDQVVVSVVGGRVWLGPADGECWICLEELRRPRKPNYINPYHLLSVD